MRHSFTPEQTREGGVAAQKIQAERRRIKPSSAEKLSREKVADLGYDAEYEYAIPHENGYLYLDIYIPSLRLAIEVDGSNGWHGHPLSKTLAWDELKARVCYDLGIEIIRINKNTIGDIGETINGRTRTEA